MADEIDALRQQLVLAGKYGQSLMIENNEVRLSINPTSPDQN